MIKLTQIEYNTLKGVLSDRKAVMLFAVAQPIYDRLSDVIQALVKAKNIKLEDCEVIE